MEKRVLKLSRLRCSPILLVSENTKLCQNSTEIIPNEGVSCGWGGLKFAFSDRQCHKSCKGASYSHSYCVCRSSYFYNRALRHTRQSLTDDMAKTVAASINHTRTDYANSLIRGSINIKKLQRVQTSVAGVVLPNLSQQPATALFFELHWLLVNSRITTALWRYRSFIIIIIIIIIISSHIQITHHRSTCLSAHATTP